MKKKREINSIEELIGQLEEKVPHAFATEEETKEYERTHMPEWMQKVMNGEYKIVPLNEAAIKQTEANIKSGDAIPDGEGFRYKRKKRK